MNCRFLCVFYLLLYSLVCSGLSDDRGDLVRLVLSLQEELKSRDAIVEQNLKNTMKCSRNEMFVKKLTAEKQKLVAEFEGVQAQLLGERNENASLNLQLKELLAKQITLEARLSCDRENFAKIAVLHAESEASRARITALQARALCGRGVEKVTECSTVNCADDSVLSDSSIIVQTEHVDSPNFVVENVPMRHVMVEETIVTRKISESNAGIIKSAGVAKRFTKNDASTVLHTIDDCSIDNYSIEHDVVGASFEVAYAKRVEVVKRSFFSRLLSTFSCVSGGHNSAAAGRGYTKSWKRRGDVLLIASDSKSAQGNSAAGCVDAKSLEKRDDPKPVQNSAAGCVGAKSLEKRDDPKPVQGNSAAGCVDIKSLEKRDDSKSAQENSAAG